MMDEKQAAKAGPFLTTEHFTLQGMRAGTISEANGRTSSYLTAVSSALVALAFVAQIAHENNFFVLFGLVILPVVIYLGVTTFIRMVQLRAADMLCTQAINRIHRFYLDIVPDAEPYFSGSGYDDFPGILQSLTMVKDLPAAPLHRLVSSAGQIEMVNSFICGVFVALLSSLFGAQIGLAAVVGVIGGLIGYSLHVIIERKLMRVIMPRMEVRFPGPAEDEAL